MRKMFVSRASVILVLGCAMLSARAAGDGTLQAIPSAYNPAKADVRIGAEWVGRAGAPDPGGVTGNGLVLSISDTVAYPPGASAVATVTPAEDRHLRHLAFDHKIGTHCSGGSPRWVVETTDGGVYAFGCASGVRQIDLPGAGWERITFACEDVQVLTGVPGTCPLGSAQMLSALQLVHDESGSTTLDNLDVDFVVVRAGR